MWDEPYLESCCRSALHRLSLAASDGRPAEPKDLPCLDRLEAMGLAERRAPEGRTMITAAGTARHRAEIMATKSS